MPKTQEDLFSDHKREEHFSQIIRGKKNVSYDQREENFSQIMRTFFKWFLDIAQFPAMLVGYTGEIG